ncbi:MAG: hypothetical protein AAGC54_04105 [Cyanobacteria bacterium P01_F01_bin.4]
MSQVVSSVVSAPSRLAARTWQLGHTSLKIGLSLAIAQILLFASSASANSSLASAIARSFRPQPLAALADGIYLYGQAPDRNELGSVYLVFEVNAEQTVGAFYMPASSFDCFYGNVTPDALDLTVVDSYEQTHHPYSIALEITQPLVAGAAADSLGLQGFHPIAEVTAQEHQILGTCQANYEEMI